MSQEESADTTTGIQFGGITPILRVNDLDVSLRFYGDALGFKIDWGEASDGFVCVSRGKAPLMLCARDQGQLGTWAYVGISDADAFYNELLEKGVTVRHPPTNYPWHARELQVEDPDGHVLRFGSDATNEDFGAFKDGKGNLCLPQPDGGWISG